MSIKTNSSANTSINLNQTDYEQHNNYDDDDDNEENRNEQFANGLSASQLKSKLLHTIKTKGILNSIKSQLRNKLVLELNTNIQQTKYNDNTNGVAKIRANLALNTVNSLILNHLKSYEYDYTLSVFMPECGINSNEVYSMNDMFHILKISPDSKLFKELNDLNGHRSKGLLWNLINYFCSHYVTNDGSTQTDTDGSTRSMFTLDHKLKLLERQYADKSSELDIDKNMNVQERLLSYQKQIEQRYKKEYEQKLEEFKENEHEKLKIEERDRFRTELAQAKHELERLYKTRYDSLSDKEKNVDELLKQKHDIEQREIFMQRQHILNELGLLRDKEMDFKRNCDIHAKQIENDLIKLKNYEEQLKKREFELKLGENNMEQRLCNEREKYKFDLERAFLQREVLSQNIEKHNSAELKRIETEKQQIERVKNENQALNLKLTEIQSELLKYKNEKIMMINENKMFKEKLTEYLNYDVLKEENTILKAQLETIKIHLGEKLVQKYQQIKQISDGKGAFKLVGQRRRNVSFANKLINETENGGDGDAGELNGNELYEIGDQLLNTADQQILLEHKFEEQTLANHELRDLCEMQLYESRQLQSDVADMKVRMKFAQHGVLLSDDLDHVSDLRVQTRQEKIQPPKTPDTTGFIECAKERLRNLECEAERVEKHYRDYQHKMTSITYPTENENYFGQSSALLKIKIDEQYANEANNKQKNLDLSEFVQSTIKNSNLNKRLLQSDIDLLLNKTKSLIQDTHAKNESKYFVGELNNELNEYRQFSNDYSALKSELQVEPKVSVTRTAQQSYNNTENKSVEESVPQQKPLEYKRFEYVSSKLANIEDTESITTTVHRPVEERRRSPSFYQYKNDTFTRPLEEHKHVSSTSSDTETPKSLSPKEKQIKTQIEHEPLYSTFKKQDSSDDNEKSVSTASSLKTHSDVAGRKQAGNGRIGLNKFESNDSDSYNDSRNNFYKSNTKAAPAVKIEYEPDSEQSDDKIQIENMKSYANSDDEDF